METENITGPINLGNPDERTIKQLAEKIKELIPESTSNIVYKDLPSDDPIKRNPDITRAREILGWNPTVETDNGLQSTIDYFKDIN